jgi:hypothetical protein
MQRYDSLVVRDSIVYKDRLVPFYIPGETVRKDSLIPGIPEKINTRPMTLENKYAIAKAWIENSILKMQLDQKDQVIKFKLDSADKVAKHWEYKYTNEKQTITLPPVKYIPGVYSIAFWLWVFIIITGLGLFVWKIFKPKFITNIFNKLK